MTRDQIVQSFERKHKHWRYREVDGLVSAYAEHAVVESPVFGRLEGRAEIADSFHELLKVFHGWTFDGDDLLVEGDRAVQMFHLQGMHSQAFFGIPPSWRAFDVHGVTLLEFDDELIVHERRMYDLSNMLIQLGVLTRTG
jgi:steroid delta-isomerase-like uncharacterized protein